MNNNMPNNNNGNQDLNSFSLGSIGNTEGNVPVPPIENLNGVSSDVPPVSDASSNNVAPSVSTVDASNNVSLGNENIQVPTSVPSLDDMSSGSEIPPVSPIPPVQPVSYDVPETINNFSTTPVFNEIGTVPPINNIPNEPPIINTNEPKKKGNKNKLIFIIIIILSIAAVGVGVYILLGISNKPTPIKIEVKDVEIEAGSEISTDINDYASFSGINSANCTLDTSGISDTKKVGSEYPFNITCGANKYEGVATIVDKTAPVVVLKEVMVQVNGEVSPEDFIDSCTDATSCSYRFSDENVINNALTKEGNYKIDIIVEDESSNEVTVSATLIVTIDEVPEEPDLYLSCTMDNETLRLPLNASVYEGTSIRTYTFTFDSDEEYISFKSLNEKLDTITYENVTGSPSFDDNTNTLTITVMFTKEELDQEAGSTLPTAYGALRQYYQSQGYTCKLTQP